MKRRLLRPVLAVLICAMASVLSSCTWLRNEFFVFDVAPPAPVEAPEGTAAPR